LDYEIRVQYHIYFNEILKVFTLTKSFHDEEEYEIRSDEAQNEGMDNRTELLELTARSSVRTPMTIEGSPIRGKRKASKH